jgi:hypothetical protein
MKATQLPLSPHPDLPRGFDHKEYCRLYAESGGKPRLLIMKKVLDEGGLRWCDLTQQQRNALKAYTRSVADFVWAQYIVMGPRGGISNSKVRTGQAAAEADLQNRSGHRVVMLAGACEDDGETAARLLIMFNDNQEIVMGLLRRLRAFRGLGTDHLEVWCMMEKGMTAARRHFARTQSAA